MLYIKKSELYRLLPRYKKNWWLFALSLAGCLCVAALFIFVKNKKFEVYTSVKITDGSAGSSLMATMAKNSGFGDILGMGGTEVDNEMVIMESHHVLYGAVKSSGYNVQYSSRPFIKRRNYYKDEPIRLTAVSPIYSDTLQEGLNWKIKVAADGRHADVYCKTGNHGIIIDQDNVALPANLKTDWGEFQLETTPFFESGKSIKVMVSWYSYTSVAQALMRDMSIGLADKKADIVQLSYKDPIPDRCKDLLNAIVASYERYSMEAKDKAAMLSMDFMQERIDSISLQLASLEAQIEEYKLSHKLSDIQIQAELALQKASTLEEQITQLELLVGNITEIENYLNKPERQLDPLPLVLTGSQDATDAIMDYNTALNQYLDLKRTTSPSNPTLIAAQQGIENSRNALKLTIKTVRNNAQSSLRKLEGQSNKLQNLVGAMPTMEREYVDLVRQQELKQKVYVMLLAQQEQNALNLSNNQPKAQLVDEAYSNVLPSGPKASFILLIALFFALFLPVAWLRFLDMLCPTVQSPERLKRLEGFGGDIHTIRKNNQEDLKQLALGLASLAREKDINVVQLSMQEAEGADALVAELEQQLCEMPSAHKVNIIHTPVFTESSEAMYQLASADTALLVTREGVTRCEHLPYLETLIDKQLLKQLLTAYQF